MEDRTEKSDALPGHAYKLLSPTSPSPKAAYNQMEENT